MLSKRHYLVIHIGSSMPTEWNYQIPSMLDIWKNSIPKSYLILCNSSKFSSIMIKFSFPSYTGAFLKFCSFIYKYPVCRQDKQISHFARMCTHLYHFHICIHLHSFVSVFVDMHLHQIHYPFRIRDNPETPTIILVTISKYFKSLGLFPNFKDLI